jgi:hypothetical protein
MADPHALKIADPHAHDAPPVTTLTPVNPHWLDDSIITLARVRHAAPPQSVRGPSRKRLVYNCVQAAPVAGTNLPPRVRVCVFHDTLNHLDIHGGLWYHGITECQSVILRRRL